MLHLQSLCCYTEVWYRHHTALPIVTCVEQDTWFNPFVLELNTQCDLQQTTTGQNIKGRITGHNWPLAVVNICYFEHHTAHCLSIMFGISGFVGLNCSTSQISFWVVVCITEPHWLKQYCFWICVQGVSGLTLSCTQTILTGGGFMALLSPSEIVRLMRSRPFLYHCNSLSSKIPTELLCSCHAGLWESRYITAFICNLDARWRWFISFMPWPFYTGVKKPQYSFNGRLSGPKSWSGCFGGEKNLPCWESIPQLSSP
jgi:hypothetical protein